jgi:hypothetical protein
MQKHLGNDSLAIRFTALRSVFAAVRFRRRGHSSYLGLQGAKPLPTKGSRKVKTHSPIVPKPGSNGNPFYCLKWIRLSVLPDVLNLQ